MTKARNYLIDTQCWLWWHIEPERLGQQARECIENGDKTIFFSVVSAWEIVIKHGLNKLKLPFPPGEYIPKRLASSYMDVLPVHLAHTLYLEKLPDHHKDPFDRLLVAQAMRENLTLISSDLQLRSYDVDAVF